MIDMVHDLSALRATPHPDPVTAAFARLSGRKLYAAHTWLRRGYNAEVELALRAHREAGALARREAWAAGIVAELHHVPERVLDDDFILEHFAADQLDDNWRVNFLNYRSSEARRQWCRALSRYHSLNLSMMRTLKADQ